MVRSLDFGILGSVGLPKEHKRKLTAHFRSQIVGSERLTEKGANKVAAVPNFTL